MRLMREFSQPRGDLNPSLGELQIFTSVHHARTKSCGPRIRLCEPGTEFSLKFINIDKLLIGVNFSVVPRKIKQRKKMINTCF